MADVLSLEERVAKIEGWVEGMSTHFAEKADLATILARVDSLNARLDRLEVKVERIPWFILASWLTTMLALIGGLYLR